MVKLTAAVVGGMAFLSSTCFAVPTTTKMHEERASLVIHTDDTTGTYPVMAKEGITSGSYCLAYLWRKVTSEGDEVKSDCYWPSVTCPRYQYDTGFRVVLGISSAVTKTYGPVMFHEIDWHGQPFCKRDGLWESPMGMDIYMAR